ncbi:MAG: DUF6503 family protein [Saprospiraceae bacterium]|nr:DUF6503 family protein [Saprospiraceae bacterium]
MRYLIATGWLTVLFWQCNPAPGSQSDVAQEIVDRAIAEMGGSLLDTAVISFDFRDRSYRYERTGGLFAYHRIFIDTTSQDTLLDILTNEYLKRWINGEEADITAERRQAFSNSVNSVIYFALLPYGLNDPAVIKSYEGEVEIKDKRYHQVRVSFQEEGGGVDYEDNFLYWFDPADASMDYLAYDYITDGGGVRFREAFNPRIVGGVTFQDYYNYKPADPTVKLDDMLAAFQDDQLTLLSNIELKNIQVINE